MLFLIILAVLFAERYLLEQEDFRQHLWFKDYCRWYRQLPFGEWLSESKASIIGILLLPLGLLLIVHSWSVSVLGGVPEWILAFAVLIVSLGPRDLEHQVSAFLYARDHESPEANKIASEIIDRQAIDREPEQSIEVSQGIVEQANNRLMAVLFWFVVLGPFGAVLYRLTSLAEQFSRNDESRKNVNQQAFRMLHILNWLPARLLAATYALVGNFDNVLLAWRHWSEGEKKNYESDASGLLIMTGSAALGYSFDKELPESIKNFPPLVEDSLGLVLRSLVICVILLGIFQIVIWLT
jgi:AmpE protein